MERKVSVCYRLLSLSFVVFFCSQLLAQVDHWETVVNDNDTWNYTVPSAATSASWIQPSFAPSGWSSGPGGFGFADGDDNTVLPTSSISVYHRIDFSIIDVSVIDKAILNIDYDDGYVGYHDWYD